MNSDLQDMLKISVTTGADPRLVQGGGGNTSVKIADTGRMYVKASGTGLADMRKGAGYREVDVAACLAMLDDEALAGMDEDAREMEVVQRLLDACTDDLQGRPSVETGLHALLKRCVVHTHPSPINGLLCAFDGLAALSEVMDGMDIAWTFVPGAVVGYRLAAQMQKALADHEAAHGCRPQAIFLENHGLFVTDDDADAVLRITIAIFRRIEALGRTAVRGAALRPTPAREKADADAAVAESVADARHFYSLLYDRPAVVRFSDEPVVTEFLRNTQARALAAVKPMTPDQALYCKGPAVWVAMPDDPADLQLAVSAALQARLGTADDTPTCMLIEGLGMICGAPNPKLLDAIVATAHATLETLTIASQFGGARPLPDETIEWIFSWEVERFRHQVASGAAASGDLAGKVALITGAGSGIGRGIAEHLTSIGVHVVLADIDLDSAGQVADEIRTATTAAIAVPIDVTCECAVVEAFNAAIRTLGGVDIVVNCAGIAPAHPLVDFPLKAWRRTLEINLTGYFLPAREAARCMIRQGTGGSIVNISSKSGLDASKNNSAYNATKSGEIHLARGWALELAEHGIRVNSICPGNIFKGSRIWNEEYIEAVAAKRGLEPDEVIPFYVNMTALKKEIFSSDIGKAVAFLSSSDAGCITGQTLVVDGGQVFVR
jgi:NAD(P)-dependent dehydrogenase (short-subunit alcohol dehydrogenase family)/rhamnose utilization protein RhaD (predicted bifunctional aldolase and dehydrogenase)